MVGINDGQFFFAQDDDCHWYLVPTAHRQDFFRIKEEARETEYWDEFVMRFDPYRIDGAPSDYDFSLPLKLA